MEVICNYRIDEGRPLGIGFQEQVSKAFVVNVDGKSRN